MTTPTVSPYPRELRPARDPIGHYLRASKGDSAAILNFLEARGAQFHGVVFDATRVSAEKELRALVLRLGIDALLDPRTAEMATPGGFTQRLASLPWGGPHQHHLSEFRETPARRRALALAEFVKNNGFTKVLAPTHLVRDADDEWVAVDVDMALRLREALAKVGCDDVPIVYPVLAPYSLLRDESEFDTLLHQLARAPVGEYWLRIDRFGSDASPTGTRNFIETAKLAHTLGRPVVADHVGGLVGLSLVAFGAVGGLCHGVTLRERFSTASWMTSRDGNSGFSHHPRVYIAELDLHMKPEDARDFFDSSPRAKTFGCKDEDCCPHGISDMIQKPGRHFLVQRVKQLASLSRVPEQLRSSTYLEHFLRPCSDRAMSASNLSIQADDLRERLKRQRIRIDSLRDALTAFAEKRHPRSYSGIPQTRPVRISQHASR